MNRYISYIFEEYSATSCRETFLARLASRLIDYKNVKEIPMGFCYSDGTEVDSNIKKRIIAFCERHKYNSPTFSFDEKRRINYFYFDTDLTKNGFVLHYLLGLLTGHRKENNLYNANKKAFDNNKRLRKHMCFMYSTVENVLQKLPIYRGFAFDKQLESLRRRICRQ